MTESQFLAIVRSVRPEAQRGWLDRPVSETALDSFDLLELRSALEARGLTITDEAWLESPTLRRLLATLS
jgi:hypothetical protein